MGDAFGRLVLVAESVKEKLQLFWLGNINSTPSQTPKQRCRVGYLLQGPLANTLLASGTQET